MAKRNLQNQDNLKQNNFEDKTLNLKKHFANYIDGALRGLIAFLFIGIGLYIFLVGFLKINPLYVLPIVFLFSIFVSPYLSKIQIGEKIVNKYDAWLSEIGK